MIVGHGGGCSKGGQGGRGKVGGKGGHVNRRRRHVPPSRLVVKVLADAMAYVLLLVTVAAVLLQLAAGGEGIAAVRTRHRLTVQPVLAHALQIITK